MGWFGRSKAPTKKRTSGNPVLESLIFVLKQVREDAPSKNAAEFAKVISRLERPPAPSGLPREVARLMELRGKTSSVASAPAAASGSEIPEMVDALVRTMRRLALLDEGLDRKIAGLLQSVPKKMSRVEAHRMTKRAKELDGFAKPVRQKALEDRREMAQMLKEVSTGLSKAGSAGGLLHERVGRVVDSLSQQPSAESAADARRTLLAQVRELASGIEQLRGDLHKANERSKGLEELVASQTAEMLDLQATSALDPVTELCHRVTFDSALTFAVRRAHAAERPLSLVLLDVDHYRRILDAQGSEGMDRLLVEISGYLRTHVREPDLLARVDSSQFAILLSGIDDGQTVSIAERIRRGVARIVMVDEQDRSFQTTLSAGVAMLQPKDKPKHLMTRAADALDLAEQEGQNRTQLAT